MTEILIAVITGAVSIVAGGGGMFAYLTSKQKAKQDQHDSAVSEWKTLYDEMKSRFDEQETKNDELQKEIFDLRQTVSNLSIELQNYKKYDTYINELERYVDHLLHTTKSFVTEDAYNTLYAKKPKRNIVLVGDKT